jgi:hypothetical protein
MRELFRRPPLNHVVGFLDYGSLRAGDLASEQVPEVGQSGHVMSYSVSLVCRCLVNLISAAWSRGARGDDLALDDQRGVDPLNPEPDRNDQAAGLTSTHMGMARRPLGLGLPDDQPALGLQFDPWKFGGISGRSAGVPFGGRGAASEAQGR